MITHLVFSNKDITRQYLLIYYPLTITVKQAHSATSIKQSPVLKGNIFVVLSYKISYELNLA